MSEKIVTPFDRLIKIDENSRHEIDTPTFVGAVVRDLEMGDVGKYTNPQLKIALNFLENVRTFHTINGDKSVASYLIMKCNQLDDIIRRRNL